MFIYFTELSKKSPDFSPLSFQEDMGVPKLDFLAGSNLSVWDDFLVLATKRLVVSLLVISHVFQVQKVKMGRPFRMGIYRSTNGTAPPKFPGTDKICLYHTYGA